MPRRLPYLPALDGLRAIAVIMVVAYHLEFAWASGGFLGVDVFFVISGYLITQLLLDEHAEHGRIELGRFWTRRFRRLVPALVAMISATLLATYLWGLPEQWRSIRVDALSALAYVANWRFVLDKQSYFDASLGPSPLLHTWSLAVEEQWYLLWPIAMAGLCVWTARRTPVRATFVVLGAATASAIWMAWLFDPSDPSRVYFGTDTRAQQLLIGAGLAWLLHSTPSIKDRVSSLRWRPGFVAALGGLLAIAVMTDDQSAWLYRGGLLAVSALAAVVVLGTTTGPGTGLTWLGWGPLVWLGRRSYGIYLWHWPVIVFMDPATGGTLDRWQLVTLEIGVTLVLTELSLRLVETPVRRSTWSPVGTVALWTGGALVVGAVGFVGLTPPTNRELVRSDAEVLTLDALPAPSAPENSAVAQEPEPAPDSGQRRVLLLGDSAAYSLADQFEQPADSRWDVQAFGQFGCPITRGQPLDAGATEPIPLGASCRWWDGVWQQFVTTLDPDVVVVMLGAWEVLDRRVDGVDVRFGSERWSDDLREALRAVTAAAATTGAPVVFLEVPCMGGVDNPGTTARSDPDRVAAVNEIIGEVAAERDDVTVAPLASVICPNGDQDLDVDGVAARYDGVHYTRAGATLVWPWLFDELDAVVGSGSTTPPTSTTVPG